jgi:pseudouridine-5'-phosphate glycosidase
MDEIIARALEDAEKSGINGKDVTPFILKRIRILTQGDSVSANRSLIEGNVVRGTKVAVELAALESENPVL